MNIVENKMTAIQIQTFLNDTKNREVKDYENLYQTGHRRSQDSILERENLSNIGDFGSIV